MDKNQKVQSRFCVRAGVSRAYCKDFWICESPLDLIRKSMDFLRKSTGLLALRARSPWTSGFQKHCFWPRATWTRRAVFLAFWDSDPAAALFLPARSRGPGLGLAFLFLPRPLQTEFLNLVKAR